jgi:peptidoglycan hydrolase-like protein with peptidoglycan-binding domain
MKRFSVVLVLLLFPAFAFAASFSRYLSEGSSGADVLQLQEFLHSEGYLSVSPTGYFGSLTAGAVAQFQNANGISPLGKVGPVTLALLNKVDASAPSTGSSVSSTGSSASGGLVLNQDLAVGSSGAEVTALQQELVSLGLLNTTPTGYFGSLTEAAVKAFQASHGIAAVGTVGPVTRAAFSSLALSSSSSCSIGALFNAITGQPCTTNTNANVSSSGGGGGSSSSASVSAVASGGGGSSSSDDTGLTVPADLSATAVSSSQVNLTWSVPTDTGATVTGYQVFRNGVQIASPSTTSYSDSGLAASTNYSYTVDAVDSLQNISAQSSAVTATTQGVGTQTNPSTAPNANSPLGINLQPIAYWSTEQPFLNIFKSSGAWITTNSSTWDTKEESSLQLDSNGYPTSLVANPVPVGGQKFTSVRMLMDYGLTNTGNGYYPAGEYIVTYQGSGTLSFGGNATVVSSSTDQYVINVANPSSAGIWLSITSTDPQNYIRNISVVLASEESAYVSGQLFNPTFVADLQNFRVIRFLQWFNMDDSENNLSSWTNRPLQSNAFWGTAEGVPIETAVALANTVPADAWLSVPIAADDNYITQMATLVHNTLGKSQKVYVELSNEVWNSSYSQSAYAEAQGEATFAPGLGSPFDYLLNWYGMRAAQTCDIWKSTWGSDAGRVVCVLGAQAANTYTASEELKCPFWTSGAPCSSHGFDAVAIAPYFGGNVPTAWTTQPDGGLDSLFTSLTSQNDPSVPVGGWLGHVASWETEYATLLAPYNIPFIAYEGGQGFESFPHGVTSSNTNNATTNLYIAANEDPRMGAAYTTYFDQWKANGGQLFVDYADIDAYSQYGEWGALQTVMQPTTPLASAPPKWQALQNFISQNPCWWSGCSSSGTTSTSNTTPPSVPANLSTSVVSSSAINLSWGASTPATGATVTGYQIFRNGAQVGSPSTNSYSDSALTASTAYSYTVKAVDSFGNVSAASGAVSATTKGSSSPASPSGSTIPTMTQLVDSSGNSWTLTSGVVYENAAKAGYSASVTTVLYYNGTIYQENSSAEWFAWTGTTWVAVGNDPRNGLASASPRGSTIPSLTQFIDSNGTTWTVTGGVVYENTAKAGYSANVILLLYYNGVVYQENSSDQWFSWNDAAWVSVSADPRLAHTSPSGSTIPTMTQLIDSSGNTWTLTGGVVYENAAKAGYSANVISLLYYNGYFYQENSSDAWFVWIGTTWIEVGSDPRNGLASASPSGSSVPSLTQFIDTNGNRWTITGGVVYEDGFKAGYSANVILLLYYNGLIYQENSSNQWFSWNGASWVSVSADPRG